MGLNIHLKYNLGDEVYISKLEINGTIQAIWITDKCTKYEVRYFNNGDAKEIYFLENELSKKNSSTIGFNLK